MAERLPDGTIRMSDGALMYGNSIPTLKYWPEILDLFAQSPAAAAAREIKKTSTESFLREVTSELHRSTARSKMPPRTGLQDETMNESSFRSAEGKVYHFRLVKGRESAAFWIGYGEMPLSIGMGAVWNDNELDRARNMLGIDRPTPEGYWFEACISGMKVSPEGHLGSSKLYPRRNRTRGGNGRKMRIGKPTGNYPKGKR